MVDGYSIVPKEVPKINTEYRTIQTKLPVPESVPLIERLRAVEAYSLHWQYPIFWDRAEGVNVSDKYGNKWLDLSSGIAVANIGHARQEVVDAIIAQAQSKMLYNFVFPSEIRLRFLEKLIGMTPDYLEKAFLMCAGSEACENMLKLIRKSAHLQAGPEKNVIVTFNNSFHGRTYGSQMMGGLPALKDWIVKPDTDIIQVPFPDGFYNEDLSFDSFEAALADQNIDPNTVAGVVVEPVQGANVHIMPKDYAQKLSKWCKANDALFGFDEVQMGFGRTGKLMGYMLYDVEADIISLGKGISGSTPVSATLSRKEVMDGFAPGGMTSTHTGNPVALAAALANLELYTANNITEVAAKNGEVLQKEVRRIAEKYDVVGVATGVGMIAGLQIVEPGTKNPQKQWAYEIIQKIIEKGCMMFAPVGFATVKIAPPLIMEEEPMLEAMSVVDEAIGDFVKEKNLS